MSDREEFIRRLERALDRAVSREGLAHRACVSVEPYMEDVEVLHDLLDYWRQMPHEEETMADTTDEKERHQICPDCGEPMADDRDGLTGGWLCANGHPAALVFDGDRREMPVEDVLVNVKSYDDGLGPSISLDPYFRDEIVGELRRLRRKEVDCLELNEALPLARKALREISDGYLYTPEMDTKHWVTTGGMSRIASVALERIDEITED